MSGERNKQIPSLAPFMALVAMGICYAATLAVPTVHAFLLANPALLVAAFVSSAVIGGVAGYFLGREPSGPQPG